MARAIGHGRKRADGCGSIPRRRQPETSRPAGSQPFRQGLDWLDFVWSNYVVELDCKRQRDAIYQPISRMLRKAWQEATDLRRWRTMVPGRGGRAPPGPAPRRVRLVGGRDGLAVRGSDSGGRRVGCCGGWPFG